MTKFPKFGQFTAAAAVIVAMAFAAPAASAETSPPGAHLFQEKGCSGCHSIGGQGGQVGPALDAVGNRYSAEWIYTWLKNPSAVKPGTLMPNLGLSDDERAKLVFYLQTLRAGGTQASVTPVAVQTDGNIVSNPPDLNPKSPDNAYLALGTTNSYVKEQRFTLQDQIQSFIPPNYEPAFTESAFVLPPGTVRVGAALREVGVLNAGDISGQRQMGMQFTELNINRRFLDFDLFFGLDNNFTVRVNVPFVNAALRATAHPNFLPPVAAFISGGYSTIGDVSVFVKKKIVDQGNFPVGIAAVGAIRLPSGSNEEKHDPRATAQIMGMDMLLPLPAVDNKGNMIPGTVDGTFRFFSNDGRLPAPLQPGLGTVGGSFGLFVTRQFDDSFLLGRSAVHVGSLYEIRPEADGIDPGNFLTAFATFVKPVYRDVVSLDATYLLQHQDTDHYAGKIIVPTMSGMMVVDRPSFSGGTTQFLAGSLIIVPNPLFRITLSGLARVSKPELGPSPDYVVRLGLTYTFASDLFQ